MLRLTCVILDETVCVNRIRLANFYDSFVRRVSYVSRFRLTYTVLSERLVSTPSGWPLSMVYGGFRRSSPAWIGALRFASLTLALLKIVAFGLGAGEVRLGGKPFSVA